MATEHRTWVLATRHPTRMSILDSLSGGTTASPEAFAKRRRLAAATVGYHFRVLEDVGAIEAKGDAFAITERGRMLRNLAQSSR
jgi:predicted transcriptional regulator